MVFKMVSFRPSPFSPRWKEFFSHLVLEGRTDIPTVRSFLSQQPRSTITISGAVALFSSVGQSDINFWGTEPASSDRQGTIKIVGEIPESPFTK